MSVSSGHVADPSWRSGKVWAVVLVLVLLGTGLGALAGRWTSPQAATQPVGNPVTGSRPSVGSRPAAPYTGPVQPPRRMTYASHRLCQILAESGVPGYGSSYVQTLGCR